MSVIGAVDIGGTKIAVGLVNPEGAILEAVRWQSDPEQSPHVVIDRIADKKIFQGYVLVEMRLSDETWYIIRNTPGVTGFVGTGTQPTPVSEKEIEKIKRRMGVEDPKFTVNYEIGEVVSVTDGPFKGFEGTISEIDGKNGKLKLMISMFGRDTAVELDALQVKKIDD